MKKIYALIFALMLTICIPIASFADSASNFPAEDEITTSLNIDTLNLQVGGACLMEATSGTVIYTQNEHRAASVASVTKVMTLLLVAEALENGSFGLQDSVYISSYAASMGGSQVFLEEGEQMTVDELIKCTVIASANDAAVALAELTCGSESAFVKRMNERAVALGLKNTSFENVTGLDDTTVEHYSSPIDIAIMSRELIKHESIMKYASVWQDSVRGGDFTLTNTNRLVRYYKGCNGLKTGSTDKAGYCVSATAKRGDMQLIAVITGAESKEIRNDAARTLLDFGFANYSLVEYESRFVENVPVHKGKIDYIPLYSSDFSALVEKSLAPDIDAKYSLPEYIDAPVARGSVVGKITYYLDGNPIGEADVITRDEVERLNFIDVFLRVLKNICAGA